MPPAGLIRSGKIRKKLCFMDNQEMSGNVNGTLRKSGRSQVFHHPCIRIL